MAANFGVSMLMDYFQNAVLQFEQTTVRMTTVKMRRAKEQFNLQSLRFQFNQKDSIYIVNQRECRSGPRRLRTQKMLVKLFNYTLLFSG